MKRNRERREVVCGLLALTVLLLALAGWGGRMIATTLIASNLGNLIPAATLAAVSHVLAVAGAWCWGVAGALTLGAGLWWSLAHSLFTRGPRHALAHARILRKVRRSLLDVGNSYVVEGEGGDYIVLPKIHLTFDEDMVEGTITITNSVKYHARLEDINLTPALGKYSVVRSYTSKDGNAWIYQIRDTTAPSHLKFSSVEEFRAYMEAHGKNKLVLDRFTSLPQTSGLVVGTRGSGKSYQLYNMILQALTWEPRPVMYFVDLKQSGLGVLGRLISPEHTAVDIDAALDLLEEFHAAMKERMREMESLLSGGKLDTDFKDYELPAYILVFDEYAVTASFDKKTRDRIEAVMRNVVLLGRQVGAFAWISLQKSDATTIPTAIRDNLPLKIVLGNAPATTLETAYGRSAGLTGHNFKPGEGLCSLDEEEPHVISCPTLNFDIMETALPLGGAGAGYVITGTPTPQEKGVMGQEAKTFDLR